MIRSTLLAMIACAALGTGAYAADLPAHSRIGAIFAQPAPHARARVVR